MAEDLSLDALVGALVAQARQGRPIAYAVLAAQLGLREGQRIHRLTQALEALMRLDQAAGRPLLASLAIGRQGLPGRGFFQLLHELGLYDGPDAGEPAAARHREELRRAVAYWGAG